MSHIELNAHGVLLEARRAEANALAYMIVSLTALLLAVALVAWAIWA
ncbi:hypothetical protein [Sphingobium agri]|uniref:Uncharacterized protein n=1 Tax=Sphingobium agri TaxID=2933566 RepID=A0ABT0DX91_9SPHN|nr:hypothetical protein [Sphingobium agri]MCK0531748.1 hypothetical protein [Sphingobium agri]